LDYRNNLSGCCLLLTSSAESSIFCGFQEAAYDAEKVFLAAIDKFDAMMSKGNVYAPDGE
jgi:hypothetical protein